MVQIFMDLVIRRLKVMSVFQEFCSQVHLYLHRIRVMNMKCRDVSNNISTPIAATKTFSVASKWFVSSTVLK